jgi:hypothetical protein
MVNIDADAVLVAVVTDTILFYPASSARSFGSDANLLIQPSDASFCRWILPGFTP